MDKTLRRVFSFILVVALTLSSIAFDNIIDKKESIYAATNPSAYADSYVVDAKIIPDTELLRALKNIIGGGNNITFGALKTYTGAIDLSAYPNIEALTGLGYALKASSLDLSALTKVKKIDKYEFSTCSFTSVKLPPMLLEIEEGGFEYCQKLETINLPTSLTKLHIKAFNGCTLLDGIVIPAGIQKIGDNAFAGCASLSSIVIPDGINVTSESSSGESVNGIGTNVFNGCKGLTSIKIGAGMTAIPAGFLQGTERLLSVQIPKEIISIRDNAFFGSGITEIDLSQNTKITKITKNCFSQCYNLSKVILPDTIQEIESGAFENCTALIKSEIFNNLDNLVTIGELAFSKVGFSKVEIPGNVRNIEKGAFKACPNLTSVMIKDYTKEITDNTTKIIGAEAFKECELLKEVNLPTQYEDNIKTSIEIGTNAFNGCKRLETINYPLNLKKIGDYAFSDCSDSYTDYGKYGNNYNGLKGTTYYIPKQYVSETAVAGYSRECFWTPNLYQFYQPGYRYIDRNYVKDKRPDDSQYITENYIDIYIVEAEGKTNIHQQYVTGLKSVDLSRNTGIILGKGVYKNCKNLKTVSLPESITVIPDETFLGCATPVLSGNGTSTSKYAERDIRAEWYYGLETINMSDNVTSIGVSAFENCYNLNLNGKIPFKLKTISNKAFKGCQSIGGLVLPTAVEYIGNSAFEDCARYTDNQLIRGRGLTNCDLRGASNIKYIGEYAFKGCPFNYFLMNKEAPVRVIGTKAFYNCQFLEGISFSDSVQCIESGALGICTRLLSIDATDACAFNKDICKASVSIKKEEDGIIAYRDSNNNMLLATNNFSMTIRPLSRKITLRENSSSILPLYTIAYNGVSSVRELKIGDYVYTFGTDGRPMSEIDASPINPKIESYVYSIAPYEYITSTKKYDLNIVRLMAKETTQDLALDVQMSLSFALTDTGYITTAPSVSYIIDITKNPCKEIKTPDAQYISYADTKGKKITPEFVATYNDSQITDLIKWELDTGSQYVQLVVADDGKSATVVSKQGGYGSARVSVTAGSVTKTFYVYVSAPASSISISESKKDMMIGTTTDITAVMKYSITDAEAAKSNPDFLTFTSSDESKVKVVQTVVEDGTSICTIQAVSAGTTTIVAKSEASNKTATYTINVTSENLEIVMKDSNNNIVDTSKTIQLIGTTGQTFKYELNETVAASSLKNEIADSSVVKVETTNNQIKLTGLKKGSTSVVLYPTLGTAKDNGITLNVSVDADISSIYLSKKTIPINQTDNVFVSMENTFRDKITVASLNEYKKLTNCDIVFKSSDTSIATVDNFGNVKIISVPEDNSTVTITCEVLRDGVVKKSVTTTVKPVYPDVKSISYTGTTTVEVGKSIFIYVNVNPSNASYTKATVSAQFGWDKILAYEWFTGENLALKVTGKAAGTIKFTVKINSGYTTITKEITVTVKKAGSSGGSTNPTLKAPGKVTQLKPKAAKKKVTIKWKKVSNASGYQIQMSTKKKSGFKTIKKLTSGSKVKFVKKKLKSKKKYYFKIRAYAKNSSGRIAYGKWSTVKSVKVK